MSRLALFWTALGKERAALQWFGSPRAQPEAEPESWAPAASSSLARGPGGPFTAR